MLLLYLYWYVMSMLVCDVYVAVNSLVCHVVSHVLATVSDDPGIIDRFMLRVHGLSEYLLKYVALYTQFALVLVSDRTVRPPLFRDRISNCTNVFRSEPNRTRQRIFAFVSLLFGNLQRSKCCTHTFTVR